MSLTILVDSDTKDLRITKRAKIRQGESLVDKLYFVCETTYDEISLEDFTATLYYIDAANVSHMEVLTRDEELYKDNYYRWTMPANSEFTKMAGKTTMQLSFTHQDTETDSSMVLHTGQITIEVLSWQDYYAFIPDSSLNSLDAKMLELDNKIQALESTSEIYDKARAVDLNLNGDLLQLKNQDGEAFGNGISILTEYPDDKDPNPGDGEINIDSSDTSENG